MPRTNKLNLFSPSILLAFLAFSIIVPLPTHAADSGLIQCGRQFFSASSENIQFCTICDLISLAQNLMNQAITYFAAPIAALMLGYGGFLMVIAGVRGGNASQFTQGKKVLTSALIGIVILFCAWLMVDVVLKSIGAYDYNSVKNFGPWNVIQCESPAISEPSHFVCNGDRCEKVKGFGGSTCSTDNGSRSCTRHYACAKPPEPQVCTMVETPGLDSCDPLNDACKKTFRKCTRVDKCEEVSGTGTNQCDNNSDCIEGTGDFANNAEMARALETAGVTFDSAASCPGASPQKNFQELKAGTPLTICHNKCSTDGIPCAVGTITANPDMMKDLVDLTGVYSNNFKVNSLATGDHEVNSDHYKAKAVDLKPLNGTTYQQLYNTFTDLKDAYGKIHLIQCEFKGVKVDCASGGPDHIHVSYN